MLDTLAPTTTPAAFDARYRTVPDVVIEKLGDAMIAVQLGTDRIIELNETAARLVELLVGGDSVGEATLALAGEYDVEADVVGHDVVETIAMLVSEQVLEAAA